ALARVPRAERRGRPGLRPEARRRRPVHPRRRQRRPDLERRPELADDRLALPGRDQRPGRLPRRPEREPRLPPVHGPDPPGAGRPPAPHTPSFRPRRPRGSVVAWLLAGAATAALLGLGASLGLWWLPFLTGAAAGAWGTGPWRARWALAVFAVMVGWGAALAW